MDENKPEITTATENKKNFSYAVGNITLNFTLGIDTPDDLVNFRHLLERALVDVTAEISRHFTGSNSK